MTTLTFLNHPRVKAFHEKEDHNLSSVDQSYPLTLSLKIPKKDAEIMKRQCMDSLSMFQGLW